MELTDLLRIAGIGLSHRFATCFLRTDRQKGVFVFPVFYRLYLYHCRNAPIP